MTLNGGNPAPFLSPFTLHFHAMRITTPLQFSKFFYFNFNPKCAEWDEIFGLSVGKLYAGLYNKCLSVGILNSNGALEHKNQIKVRILP